MLAVSLACHQQVFPMCSKNKISWQNDHQRPKASLKFTAQNSPADNGEQNPKRTQPYHGRFLFTTLIQSTQAFKHFTTAKHFVLQVYAACSVISINDAACRCQSNLMPSDSRKNTPDPKLVSRKLGLLYHPRAYKLRLQLWLMVAFQCFPVLHGAEGVVLAVEALKDDLHLQAKHLGLGVCA